MKVKSDLVSLILPVCNNAKTLEASVKSLLMQTYENLEIIAYDDFSKDASVKILKTLRKTDKRLKVYTNIKRYGQAVTLNRAVKKASGQYISFMDARHLLSPDKVKRQVNFFKKNPRLVCVGSNVAVLNKTGRKKETISFTPYHNAQVVKSRVQRSPRNEITQLFATSQTPGEKIPLATLNLHFKTLLLNRHRLPKDFLRFHPTKPSLIYTRLYLGLLDYGPIPSLNNNLYKKPDVDKHDLESLKNIFIPYLKLWLKARFESNYRLPLSSLLSPFVRQA